MTDNSQWSRRKFVTGVSAIALSGTAGCSGSGGQDDVQDSDGDGVIDSEDYAPNDPDVQERSDIESEDASDETAAEAQTETETQTAEPVDPRVIDVSYPEPNGVSLDSEQKSGDSYEFHATIENTGSSGHINYSLVWLENADDDVRGPNSELVRTQRRYFSEGERRSVSMTAEVPDWPEGYGFRFSPAEVEVEVQNYGGEGQAEILLLNDEEIVERTDVLLSDQGSTTITFEPDFTEEESVYINAEARPV